MELEKKSHYCIEIYLDFTYHKKGLLEENWILLFNMIRSARHQHQYSFHTKPSQEKLIKTIKSAQNFMERMSKLLEN